MDALDAKFNEAMFDVYRRVKKEAKYNAHFFLQMITDKGGVQTAKALINAPQISAGYAALLERQRLDLTVEAVVVEDERWHPLFTEDELNKARKRLKDFEYKP